MNALDRFIDQHGVRIGRILIGLLFLISGVGSLIGFKGFAAYVGTVLPMGTLAAVVSVVIHIGGALALILGIRVRLGVYALILFTLSTVLLIHGPAWMKATDAMQGLNEMTMTLKNIAIIGGLLLVARSATPTQSSHQSM